jgi:hypothetical protein
VYTENMGSAELLCNFCGLQRPGGVAGPTPSIYICPDCIRLAYQLLEGPPLREPTDK